jgi:predicted O-linked N-acetylglucosamine transferase (SPINDLY family)
MNRSLLVGGHRPGQWRRLQQPAQAARQRRLCRRPAARCGLALIDEATQAIRAGCRAVHPFTWLALCDDPEFQLRCSRIYGAHHYPPNTVQIRAPQLAPHRAPLRAPDGRIRLAFLSADLYNHATAHLMAELFERHDRTRFETIALSFGPDRRDAMRSRLDSAFDRLARHQLAGLFLDTLLYNAHTTTSDALWAGLPVVTLKGRSFAARLAASLLHAVGLPELVTHNARDYEALALQLATDPARLARLRAKLLRQ